MSVAVLLLLLSLLLLLLLLSLLLLLLLLSLLQVIPAIVIIILPGVLKTGLLEILSQVQHIASNLSKLNLLKALIRLV